MVSVLREESNEWSDAPLRRRFAQAIKETLVCECGHEMNYDGVTTTDYKLLRHTCSHCGRRVWLEEDFPRVVFE